MHLAPRPGAAVGAHILYPSRVRSYHPDKMVVLHKGDQRLGQRHKHLLRMHRQRVGVQPYPTRPRHQVRQTASRPVTLHTLATYALEVGRPQRPKQSANPDAPHHGSKYAGSGIPALAWEAWYP